MYTLIELPVPTDAVYTTAFGANNHGMIVGQTTLSDGEHPIIWNNGQMFVFPENGIAYSVNNANIIIGSSLLSGISHATVWYPDDHSIDLGVLGNGLVSVAYNINDLGSVVGYSDITPNGSIIHGFIWSNGIMSDIGTLPGGIQSSAYAINNNGLVAGTSTSGRYNIQHAFEYQDGTIRELETFGGNLEAGAYSVNIYGNIVGEARPQVGFPMHAALWIAGVIYDLGALPGRPASRANSINNAGKITGHVDITEFYQNPRAVLWDNGIISDLNDIIEAGSGWTLLESNHITESGCIVGAGNKDEKIQPFLLIPITNSQ